jgi:nucleotidyltransferase/DNA polymerase involved in DNA repair
MPHKMDAIEPLSLDEAYLDGDGPAVQFRIASRSTDA